MDVSTMIAAPRQQRRLAVAVLAVAAAFGAGCATPGASGTQAGGGERAEEARAAIAVERDGGVAPLRAGAGPVFASFEGSPALTDAIRKGLAGAGYRLADSEARATEILRFDGAFQALRPGTRRTAELRAGPYAEKPGPVPTRSGRGGQMMLSGNPLTMVVGTIGQNVGDATSMQDRFNRMTVGDPDGICLSTNCTSWEYQQRAVIIVEHERRGGAAQKFASTARTQTRALVPAQLLQAALDDISAGLQVPVQFSFGEPPGRH